MDMSQGRPASAWGLVEQLYAKTQAAETEAALCFSIANDTFALLPYRSALVLRVAATGGLRFACASGLSSVDRKAPYGSWVEQVAQSLMPRLQGQHRFTVADVPAELAEAWEEYWPERVAVYALPGHDGRVLGVVVYLLDMDWPPVADQTLLVLHRFHGQCLQGLRLRRRGLDRLRRSADGRRSLGARLGLAATLLAVAAMFIPIEQFVISPAEIVSLDSMVVTAPVEGIVAEMLAKPNQPVKKGQLLLRLDDTAVRNRLDAARQALEVSRVDYLASAHRSFVSSERAAEVGVLKGRISERAAEVSFLREQLGLLEVRAQRDGVAVYGQESDLVGKPVSPGQRLLELADPARLGVQVWVPVADAINMEAGARFAVLLHADPLNARAAVIEQASYQASKSPDGVAAYRVRARLEDGKDAPRLGLRGNAKIDGETVALGYFLFRRPLLVLRQWLGL